MALISILDESTSCCVNPLASTCSFADPGLAQRQQCMRTYARHTEKGRSVAALELGGFHSLQHIICSKANSPAYYISKSASCRGTAAPPSPRCYGLNLAAAMLTAVNNYVVCQLGVSYNHGTYASK